MSSGITLTVILVVMALSQIFIHNTQEKKRHDSIMEELKHLREQIQKMNQSQKKE